MLTLCAVLIDLLVKVAHFLFQVWALLKRYLIDQTLVAALIHGGDNNIDAVRVHTSSNLSVHLRINLRNFDWRRPKPLGFFRSDNFEHFLFLDSQW